MEYTGKGQGNLNTVLGAVGTYGALGGGLGNLLGMGSGGSQFVNKETFDVQLQLIAAQKDNAVLAADLASEKKMVEVFNAANDKIMNVREELSSQIRDLEKTVDSNAAAQAVINCGFNSANAVLQSQVTQLMGMTKLSIPNSNICPGWGTATVSVSTGTTTA